MAVLLIASNGICHAATGYTWISKVTYYVNGEKKEVDVSFRVEGDTLIAHAAVDIDDESGEVQVVKTSGYDESEVGEAIETADHIKSSLVSENDKLYLVISDGALKIDITEDFIDGKCNGTFEQDGKIYHYEVTGTLDDYNVSIYQ